MYQIKTFIPLLGKVSPYSLPGLRHNSTELLDSFFDAALQVLESHYDIPKTKIISSSRKQEVVYIRQLLVYWLRITFNKRLSLLRIAKELGGRDHTTVIHSVAKFQDRLDTDQRLRFRNGSGLQNVREDYSQTAKLLTKCLTKNQNY